MPVKLSVYFERPILDIVRREPVEHHSCVHTYDAGFTYCPTCGTARSARTRISHVDSLKIAKCAYPVGGACSFTDWLHESGRKAATFGQFSALGVERIGDVTHVRIGASGNGDMGVDVLDGLVAELIAEFPELALERSEITIRAEFTKE